MDQIRSLRSKLVVNSPGRCKYPVAAGSGAIPGEQCERIADNIGMKWLMGF